MGWLRRVLHWVPRGERAGIHLDPDAAHWRLSCPKDFPSFLLALVGLVPEGSIAYLEGGSPPKEIEQFLARRSVPEVSHVAMGTVWPRPRVFHVPATPENLLELAEIAHGCAEPEVAIHFHVYKDGQVLLQWFDAFSDPILVSDAIPQQRVADFCARLSLRYEAAGRSA
jgi:hypothetical protein